MMQRLPLSTHFPYTTLFRSRCEPDDTAWRDHRLPAGGSCVRNSKACAAGGNRLCRSEPPSGVAGGRDRKSTRLNSSHTVISYAVFCLKKKKYKKATLAKSVH